MKHVVLATDSWHPLINGVVTTLNEMVRRLEADGIKVTVIHPGLFKNVSCPGYPDIKLAYGIQLDDKLLYTADAIHIATEGPIGLVMRTWCRKNAIAYNTSYHTNFPDYLWRYYKIPKFLTYAAVRWFHKNSSSVLVPTATTKEKLSSKGFKNLAVWGRGYDPKIFHPGYHRIYDRSKINLICVSRVSAEKNLEDFLRLSEDPKYQLWMVGDGPARVELEFKYPEVNFTGFLRGQELAMNYASADVFVFPSRSDTLGVVMIEAMACGLPVVAYPVEGPRDVITTGGVLVNDLADGIDAALNIDAQSIIKNAKEHSWDNSYVTFKNSLESLTKSVK